MNYRMNACAEGVFGDYRNLMAKPSNLLNTFFTNFQKSANIFLVTKKVNAILSTTIVITLEVILIF